MRQYFDFWGFQEYHQVNADSHNPMIQNLNHSDDRIQLKKSVWSPATHPKQQKSTKKSFNSLPFPEESGNIKKSPKPPETYLLEKQNERRVYELLKKEIPLGQ